MDNYITLTTPSSRVGANIWSKFTFWWMYGISSKCVNHGLKLSDLHKNTPSDNSEKLCDLLEKNWNTELEKCKKIGCQPSLMRAIRKTFFWSYMRTGITHFFCSIILRSIRPFFLAIFIGLFIQEGNTSHSETKPLDLKCIYGGLLVLNSFLFVFHHHVELKLSQIGMRVRVACCALIYRKMLRLSKTSLRDSSSGQIINLLSNDVSRFDILAPVLNHFWTLPIQTALITYLVWQQVQVSAFIGISVLLMCTLPVYTFAAKLSYKLRGKISASTDTRVKKMAEIISGIQVIKMYAWEKSFSQIVKVTRIEEMKIITWASYIKAIVYSSLQFIDKAILGTTVVSLLLFGNILTSDKLFSVAQYYRALLYSAAVSFPTAAIVGAEAYASVNRLQAFLLLEERVAAAAVLNKTKSVKLRNIYASWDQKSVIFTNISLNVPSGSLCAIVGPVGAGKSTIFQLLLGELNPKRGAIEIGGEVSYASQEPWLFCSTVRNNILFGQKYDYERYQRVIKSCALERDLQDLPCGDDTLVGEKGVVLSGGQKARINLARAVYRNADIYLLDDPLSAVDTHVGNHLFEECILGLLQNKTRILVTHQLQFLQKTDHLVVINDGKIEAQGTFVELSKSNLDFAKLLIRAEGDIKQPRNAALLENSTLKTSNVSSPKGTKLQNEDALENEEKSTQKFSRLAYWKYARAGGNVFALIGFSCLLIIGQILQNALDLWIAFRSKNEYTPAECGSQYTTNDSSSVVEFSILNGTKDYNMSNYLYENFKEITCENWSETNTTIYVYAGLLLSLIVILLTRNCYFFKITMISSKNLHNKMINSLLQVPMRFFDINPSGRILNRFSSDMGVIDEVLPILILESISRLFGGISMLILVFFSNFYVTVLAPFLAIAVYKLLGWYFRIAGSLKHLESIAKSPVFTHINDSLSGIDTIRTSATASILTEEFDRHQDVHTSAWYLMLASMTAFSFILDFLCFLLVLCVTFSFIILDQFSTVDARMVGLGISQALYLTGMIQYGIRQAAEVVSKMTSVERVLEYTNLDKESPQETNTDQVTLTNWPNDGAIKFHQITLRYSKFDEPVLKNVTFAVEGCEKVGIVGRTGAGKSSIIAALFRLVPTDADGFITIDNIRTENIGLNDLRKKISIIPQDPVLFCATLRYNLDPFEEYSDRELWNALDTVELKDVVQSLDFLVDEAGQNFSVGQRQLICLARAVLRKNAILVLDEATANVDPKTDALIQEAIRKQFSTCTVITIAHRLHTVMDSDKILVMDGGELVEFDSPYQLLQNTSGYLYKMVAQTGNGMIEQLHEAAEKSFLNCKEDDYKHSYL